MVVKFFSNKKGGSSKAINYLLNEREQQGTARVLQGDPQLTRQIINNIKFKQKTTVGCLSFEEPNISEEMKYRLMQDFEKHLLPGMQDRYNILWVEHTDKDRLELNFVIPKIDLETQKSLNPYFHRADLPRIEKWQDLQNLKYEFSNPKDPSKERTVEINSHIKKFNTSYEKLSEYIEKLARDNTFKNREHLIKVLEYNKIQVTRKGKDYLSIKLPDSKKARKFKGSIYNEQFTSLEELEVISNSKKERIDSFKARDINKEKERLERELFKYTENKRAALSKLYTKNERKELVGAKNNKEIDITTREIDDDSIGTTTFNRIRERTKELQRNFASNRQSREKVHRSIGKQERNIFRSVEEFNSKISNKHKSTPFRISGTDAETERELLTKARENTRAYQDFRVFEEGLAITIREIERAINAIGIRHTEILTKIENTLKQQQEEVFYGLQR